MTSPSVPSTATTPWRPGYPKEEALFLEPGEDSPYANLVVVREADKDNEALVKLDELLHSEEVKQFILDTYTDGSVIPAF